MVIGIKMVHWWFLLEEGWSLDRLFFARSPYNRGEEVPSYCMHLKRHRNCPFHVAKCFAQMAFPMVYNYNILLFITPWPSLTLGRKCEVFRSMWNDRTTFRNATETFWRLLLQRHEFSKPYQPDGYSFNMSHVNYWLNFLHNPLILSIWLNFCRFI